jgi:hypothetical protein
MDDVPEHVKTDTHHKHHVRHYKHHGSKLMEETAQFR